MLILIEAVWVVISPSQMHNDLLNNPHIGLIIIFICNYPKWYTIQGFLHWDVGYIKLSNEYILHQYTGVKFFLYIPDVLPWKYAFLVSKIASGGHFDLFWHSEHAPTVLPLTLDNRINNPLDGCNLHLDKQPLLAHLKNSGIIFFILLQRIFAVFHGKHWL